MRRELTLPMAKDNTTNSFAQPLKENGNGLNVMISFKKLHIAYFIELMQVRRNVFTSTTSKLIFTYSNGMHDNKLSSNDNKFRGCNEMGYKLCIGHISEIRLVTMGSIVHMILVYDITPAMHSIKDGIILSSYLIFCRILMSIGVHDVFSIKFSSFSCYDTVYTTLISHLINWCATLDFFCQYGMHDTPSVLD
jgi:hypothetical protein